MKCQFCNAEIEADAAFCPECGKKQSIPADSPPFCPKCGNKLEEGCDFCPRCGAKINEQTVKPSKTIEAPPKASEPIHNVPIQKSKGNGHIVILVFLFIAIAIVALIVFAVRLFLFPGHTDSSSEMVNSTQIDESKENDNMNTTDEEVDLSEVDYNLLENAELSLDGIVKTAKNGGKVLQWKEELTFYGSNEDNRKILMEDTTTAYIDESILPSGFLDIISANKQISIKGFLYFSDSNLYISPSSVYDDSGKDMVAEYLESQTREAEAAAQKAIASDYDYVLPQSSSQLISGSDVSGLSLQEINYAKNEIYARHGRMFDSPELQNYFNSKSWYRGTIKPNAFSESLLSSVEKKNVEYLKEIEFSMAPNGYQLDAH